jgi:DNA integrity scanning protein DisA with diadenylate cyclase activity
MGTLMANAKKNPQKSQTLSESGNQHRTSQRVQEKLDGGVQPAIAAPNADQEVHRHKHNFPKNIKKKEVQRHEHAEHARLK